MFRDYQRECLVQNWLALLLPLGSYSSKGRCPQPDKIVQSTVHSICKEWCRGQQGGCSNNFKRNQCGSSKEVRKRSGQILDITTDLQLKLCGYLGNKNHLNDTKSQPPGLPIPHPQLGKQDDHRSQVPHSRTHRHTHIHASGPPPHTHTLKNPVLEPITVRTCGWNEERVKNPIEFYYLLDGYKETHLQRTQRFTNRRTDSVTELMRRFSKLPRVLNVTEEISTGQKSMKERDPGACTGQN